MFCSKCGKRLEDGQAFCPHCGAKCGSTVKQTEESAKEDVVTSANWIRKSYLLTLIMLGLQFIMLGVNETKSDIEEYTPIVILFMLFVTIIAILFIVINKRYQYTIGKIVMGYVIFCFIETVLFMSMLGDRKFSDEAINTFCIFIAIQIIVVGIFISSQIISLKEDRVVTGNRNYKSENTVYYTSPYKKEDCAVEEKKNNGSSETPYYVSPYKKICTEEEHKQYLIQAANVGEDTDDIKWEYLNQLKKYVALCKHCHKFISLESEHKE